MNSLRVSVSRTASFAIHQFADWIFTTSCPLCNAHLRNATKKPPKKSLGKSSRNFSNLICVECAQRLPWLGAVCSLCGQDKPDYSAVCGPCAAKTPPMDATHAAFAYATPIDHIILGLKNGKRLSNARLLGELFSLYIEPYQFINQVSTQAATNLAPPDIIVPVPTHITHLKERGFNPAAELAKIIARRLNIRLDTRLVVRTSNRPPQMTMRERDRLKMPFGTFALRGTPPSSVAIVDDVLTTGATTRTIAKHLKRAGAKNVYVWVIAKTVPHI